ncbi:DUF4062 domain-containing protein [Anoxybacillus tepidamans]|uniref:DUF4062 domain-containing protein n=1 Tax=Anoxybacteroides tepidamans TaxID=265948 RepID=UPI000486F671|nr:DUF4062 domain-containing protein [Anoxybacillus tepidamans]
MDRTTIFISSVAQDALSSIRNAVFEELKKIGHEPIRFEDSMRYIHQDAIRTCLEYVSRSDIFLLFIADKAGTFLESEGKTVTHLEFLRAYHENKRIIVYVHDTVLNAYFRTIRPQIKRSLIHHLNEHSKEPDCMLTFINEQIEENKDIAENYVWYFLYDAEQKGIYFEKCSLGVEVLPNIKSYLSTLFKESLQYLNIRSEIERSLEHVHMYGDFYELSLEFISLLENGQITNWRRLLALLRSQMTGCNIYSANTKYQQEALGSLMACKAITLYEKRGDHMICKEYDGLTTPENFSLDDTESYVVQTYKDPNHNEKLYYSLEKRICYFLFKVKDYVFCLHLPLLGEWDYYKLKAYQEHIFNAILESKGYSYCYFMKTLLGGLAREPL